MPAAAARAAAAPRPLVAIGSMCLAAAGYSIVSAELALADAMPNPAPWLRIDSADYFAWGTLFYAPVLLAGWLLASAVMYAATWALGHRPPFDELLCRLALATAIGTLATLIPDLVTSPLRAAGVIDEARWETAIVTQSGFWFWFTWVTLIAYTVTFVVLYVRTALALTPLRLPPAAAIGVTSFAAYQGFLLVFIR